MLQPARGLVRSPGGAALPSRTSVGPLEVCGPEDRFHDYVLEPYRPLAPAAGKLRSLNVLVESFALAGVEEAGRTTRRGPRARRARAVSDGLGHQALWPRPPESSRGSSTSTTSSAPTRICLSIADLRELLSPAVKLDAEEPRALPWHMFSVDLGVDQLEGRKPADAHMYIDMRCYALRGRSLVFENIYTFHDPRLEIDEILHRLRSSVHFDERRDNLGQLMTPALLRCGRMCVANKREADAVYFSRVPVPRFLRSCSLRHKWPSPLRSFVDANEQQLDHLFWDVGIDFRAGPDGMDLGKTGIYGSF